MDGCNAEYVVDLDVINCLRYHICMHAYAYMLLHGFHPYLFISLAQIAATSSYVGGLSHMEALMGTVD